MADRDDATGTENGIPVGVDDIASALAAFEVNFMTLFNQLLSSSGANGAVSDASGFMSLTNPPEINPPSVDEEGVPKPTMFNVGDYGLSLTNIQYLFAGVLATQGVMWMLLWLLLLLRLLRQAS